MNKRALFLLSLLVLLSVPLSASAFYFGAKEGVVVETAVPGNAYLAGESLYVEEPIAGDAFLAGTKVVVNAPIQEDAMLAGETVQVKADIGDDLRMAGEKLELQGRVGGELMAFGSQIELSPEASVKEGALFFGEQVSLEGKLEGEVTGAMNQLYLNTTIEGNVKLYYVENLQLGPYAKIQGNLSYRAPARSSELEELVTGEVTYKNAEAGRFFSGTYFSKLAFAFLAFSFLSALLLGLVLIASFRYFCLRLTQAADRKPLKSFLLGLLWIFFLPLLSGLLMGTLAGLPLALILLLAWVMVIYLSKILASILVAGKLFPLNEKSLFSRRFWSFALVLFIYDALTLLPLLGMVYGNGALVALGSLINAAKFLLALLSIGALMLYKTELFKEMRKKKLA